MARETFDGRQQRGELVYSPGCKTVVLRQDLVRICGNDPCAALVLGQMHYWYDRSETGWVYKSARDMSEELMGLFGEEKIRLAFLKLTQLGFLDRDDSMSKNPFNRSAWYFVEVLAIQDAIDDLPAIDPSKRRKEK